MAQFRTIEILDRGADRVQTELSSEPEVQAALMNTMGNVYASLGLYDSAQPLLDDALPKSEAAHGRRSTEVARILYGLGELARLQGDFDGAVSHHQEALAIRTALLGEKHLDIAESLHALGVAFYFQSEYEAAEVVELPRASDGSDTSNSSTRKSDTWRAVSASRRAACSARVACTKPTVAATAPARTAITAIEPATTMARFRLMNRCNR